MEVLRSNILSDMKGIETTPVGIFDTSEGFYFQQRRGHLNLRAISGLDLDRVIREVDIDCLQQHIENITYSSLREEDLRYLTDPQVIKLFRISQLTIEYLLYSQEQLLSNINKLSIKYNQKKKSLTKKRTELAELQESTKMLRNQVKAKKQNISTLEDLLKETNRTRERELRSIKMTGTNMIQQDIQINPNRLKFFIVGPEGLCVEFNESMDTSVGLLISEVRKAFLLKLDVQTKGTLQIKLIHQGKLLKESQILRETSLKEGDTVVAIIERDEFTEQSRQLPIVKPVDPIQNSLPEILEFLNKQQDSMKQFAKDIKDGWEKAIMASAPAKRDDSINEGKELMLTLDKRWSDFESGIKDQLDSKLQLYNALLAERDKQSNTAAPIVTVIRRKFETGELESDIDPAEEEINDLKKQMRNSRNKISFLETEASQTAEVVQKLQNALNTHKKQMDQLKNLMEVSETTQTGSLQLTVEPVIQTPLIALDRQSVQAPAQVITPIRNKWNAIAKTEESYAVTSPPVQVNVKEDAVQSYHGEKEKYSASIELIKIEFPIEFNPDLPSFEGEGYSTNFVVELSNNLNAEETLGEIRKSLAKKLNSSLEMVELLLYDKPLKISNDVDLELNLIPTAVKRLAALGHFRAKLKSGTIMTTAQLDVLVEKLQPKVQQEISSDLASNFLDSDNVGDFRVRGSSKIYQSGTKFRVTDASNSLKSSQDLRMKRTWNEDSVSNDTNFRNEIHDDDLIDDGLISNKLYSKVRNSLEETLNSLSEKEGLTDEELKQQRNQISSLTSTLPSSISSHMKNYRSKLAGSLAAGTVESGSDSATEERVSRRLYNNKISFGTERRSQTADTPSYLLLPQQKDSNQELNNSSLSKLSNYQLLRTSGVITSFTNKQLLSASSENVAVDATMYLKQVDEKENAAKKIGTDSNLRVSSESLRRAKRTVHMFDDEEGVIVFRESEDNIRRMDDFPMMASVSHPFLFSGQLLDGRIDKNAEESDDKPLDKYVSSAPPVNVEQFDNKQDSQEVSSNFSKGFETNIQRKALANRSRYAQDKGYDDNDEADDLQRGSDTKYSYPARNDTESVADISHETKNEKSFLNSTATSVGSLVDDKYLSTTVDSEGEMLMKMDSNGGHQPPETVSQQESEVKQRADLYERSEVTLFDSKHERPDSTPYSDRTPRFENKLSSSKSVTGNMSMLSKNSSDRSLFQDLHSNTGAINLLNLDTTEEFEGSLHSLAISEDDDSLS